MEMTRQERLHKAGKFIDSFDECIISFTGDSDWAPIRRLPEKEGWYVTVRAGLGGIYKMLDQFKDGKFQTSCLDNSSILGYLKNPVTLPEYFI